MQQPAESQPIAAVVEQQTDRAPIIVSPNNQPMDTEGCSTPQKSNKVERSVIVRAGSSSACAQESPNNVNKQVKNIVK